ncbi:hypothetical protein [Streptomyces sp. NPDC000878]
MPYRVELAVHVENALEQLSEQARHEVMETIATVLLRPEKWPPPGGWNWAVHNGDRSWVEYTAAADGIEVVNVAWTG